MQNYQVLVFMLYLTSENKKYVHTCGSDSMQKLKETNKKNIYFIEIKMVSRDESSANSAETRIL